MRPGDEVLIDLQTTALTLGEVIERIEHLRHSPRMAGHHIAIDGDARAVVLRVGEVWPRPRKSRSARFCLSCISARIPSRMPGG